ncbi:MAG TPA: peptidoglycan-binding protein [Micromonosporaceae bacterium]|nr:peptidoglycan-binding protein [Micromonosporaceae bacterium]HCU51601.1 peptidoglycan-binding protein [Micromonosporaceae bacterium]
MKRRTIVSGGIGAVVLAAAAIGLSVGLPTGTPEATAETKPQKTAKVTKQNLSDTETKNGTLGYGTSTKLNNKVNGTFTWVPVAGATIERGQTLYKVDDLPVVLFYGTLPFYRPLSAGMEGADVKQFTDNLKALGYSGFTTSAIKKWQKKLGLPETGVVEPGRVVFAAEPIRIATVSANVGDNAGPGEVGTYTATKRVITTTIEVNDARLAKVKEKVRVTLPDNKVIDGTIDSVRTVIQQNQQGEPVTRIEVTISLGDAKVDFDQASVKIAFTASTRPNVLTVPVAALLALREGGYGVEVIADGGARQIVAVTTGLFAGGRVEVSGNGISDGQTVGMPS